jgi:hypothetical protein
MANQSHHEQSASVSVSLEIPSNQQTGVNVAPSYLTLAIEVAPLPNLLNHLTLPTSRTWRLTRNPKAGELIPSMMSWSLGGSPY